MGASWTKGADTDFVGCFYEIIIIYRLVNSAVAKISFLKRLSIGASCRIFIEAPLSS
jgi:hypothetical protein